MRNLHITRERALACFALPYHCVIGQTIGEHLRRVEVQERAALMTSRENAVRNGETVCIPIDEAESTLFVIAYQEHGALTTEELPIPAGAAELHYTVATQFDGDRRLYLTLTKTD